jgi:D-alanine-D-alanine ligase
MEVIATLRDTGHDVIAVVTAKGLHTTDDEYVLKAFTVLKEPPVSQELIQTHSQSAVSRVSLADLCNVDVVFTAHHGGIEEDATLQTLLESSNIPFTWSGHIGSAITIDKDVSKRLMVAAGVPTPAWQVCRSVKKH